MTKHMSSVSYRDALVSSLAGAAPFSAADRVPFIGVTCGFGYLVCSKVKTLLLPLD